MVGIGLVGYGYWGPNLARNFSETEGAELVAVCDQRAAILKQVATRFPNATCSTDYNDLLSNPKIHAIAVATPVSTHADLALRALRAGKHVFVEKPIAASSREAEEMIRDAENRKLVLLVDHTFAYMGAVRKVQALVQDGTLGKLYYYDSARVNLGLFQRDVNVIWDLAVHDLAILACWAPQNPTAVSCLGAAHLEGHPVDTAYLTLRYTDDFIAHINVNWLSPVKIRRTLLGGERKMVVFDDLDPVEKIRVYDRGVARKDDLVGSDRIPLMYRRTGDIWLPQFDMTEALKVEAAHFIRCITAGEKPITGGPEALRVVKILEAAEESIRRQGKLVDI